jgi:hypothetical protein
VAQANGAPGTFPGCETSSTPATGDGVDPCQGEVYVSAGDDCADPGTLTFYVDATGLAAGSDYRLAFDSDAFTGSGQQPAFVYDLVTDADGAVKTIVDGTESADVRFPDGPFTLRFELLDADGGVAYGEFTVDTCEATESATPTTTAPTTTRTHTTTEAPAPTTSEQAASGSTASPTTATTTANALAAAPSAPVAARPAALATTGAPMTGMALLGAGLLVAGAGALVATRRGA